MPANSRWDLIRRLRVKRRILGVKGEEHWLVGQQLNLSVVIDF